VSDALRFENVTKRFVLDRGKARSFREMFIGATGARRDAETILALDDVSFTVPHGGTLGLIGPNGTGKSTVLKLAARILEPTAGRVVVGGRVAALLELGAGFHPDLSGRENILLNGSMMGFSRAQMRQRLDRIVAFSELERFIDMPVKHYSSGMYMRLGFAAAIHMDADTLLIDEVLAVGDQAFQNKCRDRIMALRKAGVTFVLVSHDPGAVRDLCAEALWIEDGRAERLGPTDGVVEAYYASVMVREEARFAAEHDTEPVAPAVAADRWGSGEVEITGVTFLDPDEHEQHLLYTGGPATVCVHYVAHVRVEQPVFGLGIHRDDGLHLTGPNTLDAGLEIDAIEGEGTVHYHVASLPLLPGTYEVSASCYDHSCTHPYDHHHRRFTFHVRSGDVRERLGVVRIPATWEHRPAPPEAARGDGT
jgi:lipopolysaccharide transport system ATP-binding protein